MAQQPSPLHREKSQSSSLIGVTVHHLYYGLVEEMESEGLPRDSTVRQIEDNVILKRGENIVCPRDGRMGAAYVDCYHDSDITGDAVVMLSYSWGYKVSDIADTLMNYCLDTHEDVKRTYVWICCLCINQHRVKERRRQGADVPFEEFRRAFSNRIEGIGHVIAMMAPWRAPKYITRVWCVFELFYVKQRNLSKLTIRMPPNEMKDLGRALKDRTGISEVWQALMRLDIQQATSSVKADRESIFQMIEEGFGFDHLNNVVSQCLRTWVVESTRDMSLFTWDWADDGTNVNRKLDLLADGRVKCCDGMPEGGWSIITGDCDRFKIIFNEVEHRLRLEDGGKRAVLEMPAKNPPSQMFCKAEQVSLDGAAKLCNEVGKFHAEVGNYDDAIKLYQQGWDLWTASAVQGAMLLLNIGRAKMRAKDPDGDAMTYLEKAMRLHENSSTCNSAQYAELLRNIGLLHKHNGDIPRGLERYEESCRLLEELGQLQTLEGANLLRNIGALHFDKGDLDMALEVYMGSLKILQDIGDEVSPNAARLFENIGIVKLETGDLDSALEIFGRAKLIRQRTGSWNSDKGRYLKSCIADAESRQLKQRVLEVFESQDTENSGFVPKRVLELLCDELLPVGGGKDQAMHALCSSGQGAGNLELVQVKRANSGEIVQVDYQDFVNLIFDQRGNGKPACRRPSHPANTCGFLGEIPQPDLDHQSHKSESGQQLTALVWNILSPQFAANALEYLPNDRALHPRDRATMRSLLQCARAVMVSADSSPVLGDLLGDQPLRVAEDSPVETAPIRDARGLESWLKSRQKEWIAIWPDLDAAGVAKRWLADYTFRWEFWKRQTVHEWLCDDGSGGLTNPLVTPRRPSMDETCWGLGISTADRRYPNRAHRCKWIGTTTDTPCCSTSSIGKHDFFKLLVFDLVISHIMKQQPSEAVDSLLSAVKPMSADERMLRITQRVRDVDIAIITEFPRVLPQGLDDFWIARSSATDSHLNTAILARKSIFMEPVSQDFFLIERLGGGPDPRCVACEFRRRSQPNDPPMHVIGVHLSVKGYEAHHIASQLELAIQPRTMLGGNFNVDLRKGSWTDLENFPKLAALVAQSSSIPVELGSTSKERSPFQAQISKMFLPEFRLTDFLFLTPEFAVTRRGGWIYRSQRLPTPECPSDHSPLTLQLRL